MKFNNHMWILFEKIRNIIWGIDIIFIHNKITRFYFISLAYTIKYNTINTIQYNKYISISSITLHLFIFLNKKKNTSYSTNHSKNHNQQRSQLMQTNKKQFSQSIIDSYYHRFYQGRKSIKPNSKNNQQPNKNSQTKDIKLIPQKQNIIFNINYQTNTSPSKNKKQHEHFNPSLSLNLQKDTQNSKNQLTKSLTKSNTKHSALIPQKNSLILQINIPNFYQKLTKNKTHRKPSPVKNSYKLHNFDHFPSENLAVKNRPLRNQNTKNHFIKVHNYSKTLDFDNWNPQNSLHNYSKTIQNSPQKENQFFTLQNFSHIKLHNDKKPKSSKKKDMVDIVKRKQMSQTIKVNGSQKNCRKRSLTNNFTSQQNKSPTFKEYGQKEHSQSRKGLFNEFKPTIQLKKRPSTGIPMKKHKPLYLTIQNQRRNESPNLRQVDSFHNQNRYPSNSPNKNPQKNGGFLHSRTSSLKMQSSRRLQVKTREIQTLKYVDLSQSEKVKDLFKNSEDSNSIELKNIVHLDFHRKNSLVHKKTAKKKNIIHDDEFLPWESVQKDDEIIQIIN